MKAECRALCFWSSLVFLIVAHCACAPVARTQALAPHTYGASIELSYWRESGGRMYIPLWVETPPSGEIYKIPELGVKIEGVEVDGRPLEPVPLLVYPEYGNLEAPLHVDTPFFVYQAEADTWDYNLFNDISNKPKKWTDYELINVMKTENTCEQIAYRIPYNARRIRIQYRLRHPIDGRDELGPLITVIAERYDNTAMDEK